jgi:hypothetical protein
VRISWLASSTNRRSRSKASWSRESIAFNVLARLASSSSPGGTGRRRSGSRDEIASASWRRRSTGRSAAPTSSHPAREMAASARGPAALLPQALVEQLGHLRMVLDNQYAHRIASRGHRVGAQVRTR